MAVVVFAVLGFEGPAADDEEDEDDEPDALRGPMAVEDGIEQEKASWEGVALAPNRVELELQSGDADPTSQRGENSKSTLALRGFFRSSPSSHHLVHLKASSPLLE